MTKMARRFVIYILSTLLLVTLASGWLGCKKEEEQSPQGETVSEGVAKPETKAPPEEGTAQDAEDFEEQEGVQQEDESHQDY